MNLSDLTRRHRLLSLPMREQYIKAVLHDTPVLLDRIDQYEVQGPTVLQDGRVISTITLPKVSPEALVTTYCRMDIRDVFGGPVILMDLPDHTQWTPDFIAQGLLKTFGVYLDRGTYTLTRLDAGESSNFKSYHARYKLDIMSDHLTMQGSVFLQIVPLGLFMEQEVTKRIALIDHYRDYQSDPRIPIEIVAPRMRLEDDSLINYTKSSETLLKHVAELLEGLTGDKWVCVPNNVDFNLYDAKLLYNGSNTGDYCRDDGNFSQVMYLELSRYSSNLKGVLEIAYRDKPRKPKKYNWR